MNKFFAIIFCLIVFRSNAQELTVEKIMQDPKWIGTSPTNAFWGVDSKTIYFNWNPAKNISDSVYAFSLGSTEPQKTNYTETQKITAVANAVYSNNRLQMTYSYRGDIYFVDVKQNRTIQITATEETESNPKFILNDEWIVYTKNQNLFAWNTKQGNTQQLTNITKDAEVAANKGFSGRGLTGNTANTTQDIWLNQEQLNLFQVLKERKEKKDLRDAFNRMNRYMGSDTLKTIGIGEKILQGLTISPDARFVTYRLYQNPVGTKNTIVPDYVTESGYTANINGRTKVGNPLGSADFYVWDKVRNNLILVQTDSIPGITDLPDYTKDYSSKTGNKKTSKRGVIIYGPYWNDAATIALVDIRSQDNKDRWIMELDATTGKLIQIDRQRDEAWIGGPGVGAGMFGSKIGWLNNTQFYFQSEASGYSHVYITDMLSKKTRAITSGNYEVQELVLSKSKQHFYLLTNETHPGKQHWYRMKIDGSVKEKITTMEGGYEVSLSPDEKWITYRYSYINKPWELFVQENEPGKKPIQITHLSTSEEFKKYPWREAKVITIPARDAKNIYARIYEPEKPAQNGAAVFFVHGAGYLQNVHYWWSSYFREYMFNNLLTDKGYTVIDIDYRASSGYGRDWRTGIYRHMGGKDLTDHVDVADYLIKNKGIDKNKIGLYGGSYGGFITLMALFTTPDVFKAGAALRPVTDWAHYNHGYTSNILNEPFTDSIAYAKSSPINFAAGLKNNLLICHGMVDVNVHFQDVVRLSQKLIELKKENWELAVYPVEDHGFVEPSSWTDEYKRILKLFDEKLLKIQK